MDSDLIPTSWLHKMDYDLIPPSGFVSYVLLDNLSSAMIQKPDQTVA